MQTTQTSTQLKVKLFRGFSEPSRLAIIETLRERSLTVNEIAERTGLTQPNVSNHLACLRSCGLLKSQPIGRFVRYELASSSIADMLSLADSLLSKVGAAIAACPNEPENPPTRILDQ
jgi:DNA-binding transcriptional ArsR family regulator